MQSMFKSCKELISLNLPSTSTPLVTNMASLFENCEKIPQLDLTIFNTEKVTTMENMFKYCKELNSLDVHNWETSLVENMGSMFDSCENLESLVLSNFNTAKVTNMENMFKSCTGFTSLNLANFDTAIVTNMASMFDGCTNLQYINLNQFKEAADVDTTDVIRGTIDNITYCIGDVTLAPKIALAFEEKICEYLDCDSNWKENLENKIRQIIEEGIYHPCYLNKIFTTIPEVATTLIIEPSSIVTTAQEISTTTINNLGINLVDNFFHYNEEPGVSIYSYEIGSAMDMKNEHTNLTFIEFSDAQNYAII